MPFIRSSPHNGPEPALWGLVDCATFYCSCERLFRPDLIGRPVAVLSNNDGCLIALSPETRALGYRMGDVYHLLADRLRRDGVTCFSSNYTLYGDISTRVMRTIATLAPIEQYSIDEAFLPLDRTLALHAPELGQAVRDRVQRWTGIPVRVGLGPTRTLAKLANHWAKKLSPVLLLQAGSPRLEELLEQTPCAEVWGIGRRQSRKLEAAGIVNARQLRNLDPDRALTLLSVTGQRTVYELRGQPCFRPEDTPTPRKTLVSSRSFGRRVTRKEDLAEALAMHAAIAGERLRAEGLVASALSCWAETSRHQETPYHSIGCHVCLPIPTNATFDFVRAAHQALDQCYRPGHAFMKSGLMLFGLEDARFRQGTLAEAANEARAGRHRALMAALDGINAKYGAGSLRTAAQGNRNAFWKMRREMLSGHFTTRWDDLPWVDTAEGARGLLREPPHRLRNSRNRKSSSR